MHTYNFYKSAQLVKAIKAKNLVEAKILSGITGWEDMKSCDGSFKWEGSSACELLMED